jgi:hypothetical protein
LGANSRIVDCVALTYRQNGGSGAVAREWVMSRAVRVSLTCLTAASGLAGCASQPVQTASGYADQGAHAIYRTGSDVYAGMGTAAKRPFQDLNMMQDPIPLVLLRAELDPYSVKGLTSCDVVMNRVAELDLALGPDLDAPADRSKNRMTADAGMAAAAALEAAAAAAEGFMPVRSVVKRVSGATKYEAHVKHAILAGTVRRTFLKAVGVMHNCGWPAAPLTVTAEDAKIVTVWGPTAVAGQLNAAVQISAPMPSINPAQSTPVKAPSLQAAPGAQSGAMVQTASLATPRAAPLSAMAAPSSPMSQGTPQAAAQPAALVSPQAGAAPSTPSSPGPYSPAAGSAPWASPPPGR